MPHFEPMRLSRRTEPFDSDDFIYELKIDGFRALAHIDANRGKLVSRNEMSFEASRILPPGLPNTFRLKTRFSMARSHASTIPAWPTLRDLLFRQQQCVFFAKITSWIFIARSAAALSNRSMSSSGLEPLAGA